MIHAALREYRSEEPLIPGGKPVSTFHMFLVDKETERPLGQSEVMELFQKDEITGVYVKIRGKWLTAKGMDGWPGHGIITEITEDTIKLGNIGVPRNLFHEWYELD